MIDDIYHENVRYLGNLLGEIIKEQEGEKTFNLIGWQTVDIYQNISITYLSSIKRNQKLEKKLFILPKQN